jgi:nitrate/nitrite transporter NarK
LSKPVPRDELSRANAGFTAVSSIINVVAPLALGFVIDEFGGRRMLLCAAIPVLALAAALYRLRDAGASHPV